MTHRNTLMAAALGGVILGLALALPSPGAQDEPETQRVEARGLSFEATASWKRTEPTRQFRLAQLTVPPVEGDEDPAELVVYAFPGDAGGVEANVERWQGQFQDQDGKAPEAETATVEGKNTKATRVEIAGRFSDPFSGTGPRDGYRLLGAIVVTPDASFFLKMVGPDATVRSAEEGFDRLIRTIEVPDR